MISFDSLGLGGDRQDGRVRRREEEGVEGGNGRPLILPSERACPPPSELLHSSQGQSGARERGGVGRECKGEARTEHSLHTDKDLVERRKRDTHRKRMEKIKIGD